MKKFLDILEENIAPLKGLPQKPIDLGNGEKYTPSPNQKIRDLASSYMKSSGLSYNPPKDYKTVDTNRASRIANEFDKMKHDPNHPDVKSSYKALAKETIDQFHHIKKTTGLNVDWIKHGDTDPYAKTPHLGAIDVKHNNHLWAFPTTGGFGSGTNDYSKNHPMLQKSGIVEGGHHMLVNDVFRVVHDYFGHHKEGFGFRANGEENAWRHHSAMFSPLARGAMTSETRGQNSFVNFGPNGKHNRSANSSSTIYADQKVGLMPKWTHEEGL